MTDHTDINNVPEAVAVPKKRMRFSVVWIIPVVAAIVAVGIAVQQILSKGPTITIVFKEAEGIEAGKTFVKYKDVKIGQVTKVKLSKDFAKVAVTASIDKSAAGLIVEDTKFYIEQPRVSLSGISGLGTLMSGNYIGIEIGKSTKAQHEFVGLEVPPPISIEEPGRRFILEADNLGSVGIGSPLYYRRLNVGQVVSYDLAENGRSVNITVFVKAPYDKYVTPDTRFWQASGIDVSLGAEGLSVQTQSVLSVLVGGIAFETFTSSGDVKPAAEKAVFNLYGNRAKAAAKIEEVVTPYVLRFKEGLRGLSVGAPVTFRGLQVGEVTAVGLEGDIMTGDIHPRVDIVVYLGRFLGHIKKKTVSAEGLGVEERRSTLERLVDRGVRAQLKSGSLVTGQLYVAFDVYKDVPKVKIDWTKSPPELPVVPSGLQDLQDKLQSILARLEALLKRADEEVVPEAKKTLEELRGVLKSVDTTVVGKDAPMQQDLRETLQEINRAAQAVRGLTESLERNPDAIIRGKTQEKP
jgi:paraquat-inducible protein B